MAQQARPVQAASMRTLANMDGAAPEAVRTGAQVSDPLLVSPAENSVNPQYHIDFGLGDGRMGNRMALGHDLELRKNGLHLDEPALHPVESGHIIQTDIDNPGNVGGTLQSE